MIKYRIEVLEAIAKLKGFSCEVSMVTNPYRVVCIKMDKPFARFSASTDIAGIDLIDAAEVFLKRFPNEEGTNK